MVGVFKLNKTMVGDTYYLKPIPVRLNGKITYSPAFTFMTSFLNGVHSPLFRHVSYCIVNGELNISIYGNELFKLMDITRLSPINTSKVLKINVRENQGFLDISDSNIIDLNDCDMDYKNKFIISNQHEYDELIKNISEEQLYQVAYEECHIVLSYTKEQEVRNNIQTLLSFINVRLRGLKIKKLMNRIK